MKSAWVDANVILRLLTGKPAAHARKAATLAGRAEKGQVLLRISVITVAEAVWVLHRFYNFPLARITETLTHFLCAEGVSVEAKDMLLDALVLMSAQNVDFADALLAVQAKAAQEPIASFDKDFDRLGVERLDF